MAIPSFTYEPSYSVDTTPFDSASNYLNQAAKSAMPSQAAYDTAAARIRGRLEAKQRGDENRALDVFGRSGNAGQYNQQFRQARQDSQRNLATGLADLEEGFWGKQQEGANTLANIGSQFSNIGTSKAEAGRQGEQLKMDAARGNASSFNSILSTLGQSGGVLSLFNSANANNPQFSQPFTQLFGDQFKFPDANAIASFTNSSLAGTGAGGNTPPPGPTDTGSVSDPKNGVDASQYSTAASNPGFWNRLTVKGGVPYDPVTGLYVYSDAQVSAIRNSIGKFPSNSNEYLINGIAFYKPNNENPGGPGSFPAEGGG